MDEIFRKRVAIWVLETARSGLKLIAHLVEAPELALARRLLLQALERERSALRALKLHGRD